MLEGLSSFVAMWQNNVNLNKFTENVPAYTKSINATNLKLISPSYKQHKTPVNISTH